MLKSVMNVTLLVLLVLSLLAGTILFGGILPEHALAFYGLTAALAAVWAAKLLFCRRVSIAWSAAHVPVLLFAGYTAVRSIASPIPYDARIELLHVGMYTLVYFVAACNFYRTRDRIVIVLGLVLLALGESVYGFWQYREKADVVLWLDRGQHYHGRGSGTYFCPNHLAGLLEMALGILVARLLVYRELNSTLQSTMLFKLYEFAAVVLIAFGLFSTLSRGGWIAMIAALLLFLIFAELGRALTSRFVISVFAILVAFGIWAWSIPNVRVRIERELHLELDLVSGDAPIQVVSGLGGRFPIWRATTRMIGDHLWLGTGPGTWQWFHLKYRDPLLQIHPQFAHQDILHLTSDYGLVGAILMMAFLGCFYWRAWRILRRSESLEQRAFALGAGTAVTALLVHSLADFNLHIPANTLWFVTLIGLTIAQSTTERDRDRKMLNTAGRLALGVLALAAAAGIAWVGIRYSLSARYTALGDDANQQFEWEDAQALYQRALKFEPRNPEPHAQMGDAYRMQSALEESEEALPERHRLALISISHYRQSLTLNPYQSEVMLRLAAAYELAGDYDGAARTYSEALAVDPNNAFSWLRVGMYYRRRGDTARAVEALQYSNALNRIEPIAQTYLKEIEAEQAAAP